MCNFFTLICDISPSSLALGEMQDQQQAATLDQPAEFKFIMIVYKIDRVEADVLLINQGSRETQMIARALANNGYKGFF